MLVQIPVGLMVSVILILILLGCSALISGSEVAYFSLSPSDIKDISNDGSASSRRILQLREQPRVLLATILISNNFVNIAIVILSDFIVKQVFQVATFDRWAISLQELPLLDRLSTTILAYAIEFSITVIGATFLLVLFGEVAPKLYANINNVRMAKVMSGPLRVLRTFFAPLSNVLVKWSTRFETRLAQDSSYAKNRKDDLDKAIELTVSHELNSEKEIDILKSIVKFGDVTVKQVMRPRTDVVAIDISSTYAEVLKTVKECGYSRIPVYDEDFDKIKGILYVKDLLVHLNESAKFSWQKLIRPDVKFVPEAKKINDLLTEFQQERTHMAIVVDEFGGSGGLVTLEDIMEEVIGDIRDEFDDDVELEYEKLDDFNFIFEGKTLLNDMCRVLGISTDTFEDVKGGSDSLAGLLLELLGRIPRKNLEVKFGDYRFRIVAVSTKRIEKVQVTIPNVKRS